MARPIRILSLLALTLVGLGLMFGCAKTDHRTHTAGAHDHEHAPGCGHVAVRHGDHVDYLHDGHLHHVHGDHVDEHAIDVTDANPEGCTTKLTDHEHGKDCGHEAVPHGDHVDYLVDGRLHHPHGDHCDDHGPIELAN